MTLELRSLPAFIADENAHVPMHDRHVDWLVIVTREALETCGWTNGAPDSEMLPLLPLFQALANYKLDHGLSGEEATIWILERDVIEWRSRPQADMRFGK